jgi:hypothetical protein
MAPHIYTLLEPILFTILVDPGQSPVYTAFVQLAMIKMIDEAFKCNNFFYQSYKNIYCASFCMLNELVPNQFKVSNTPSHTGWNSTMSIQDMLNKLEGLHGKPKSEALFTNDILFNSLFSTNNAPGILFIALNSAKKS